jgi:cytochrome P450
MQTASALRGFFLAMALNPSVFRKSQEEIDSIVGAERLPSISDRVHLPYTDALILELLRWNVVAPNGQSLSISYQT